MASDNRKIRGKAHRLCAACRHMERARIEFLLTGGSSIKSVAQKFGIHYQALYRHWHNHVTPERKAALLVGPLKLSEILDRGAEEGASVIDHFHAVRAVLFKHLDAAVEAGDRQSVAALSGRIIEVLRELGRASGELVKAGGITINNNTALILSPAFNRLEAELLHVLAKHPAARADVIKAFRAIEAGAVTTPARMIEARPDAA
jgi:hypothetical protein